MKALRDLLGDRFVTDPQVCAGYGIDWTGRFRGEVLAVARPRSTDEVAAVLRHCNAERIPVVPQGGNTGLVGGSVPQQPSLVLSTAALCEVGTVDPVTAQVTVGAGVTLAELQRIAHAAGFEYGVDLAARDSATIGGTVATNAGGIQVVAHGMTRAQVVGIEAVLASGAIVDSLRGLAKDNTGYDLAQLFCGSEGTLGVITRVRVQLRPPWPDTVVAMLGVASYDDALAIAADVRASGARIRAAEVFEWFGVELAIRHLHVASPLPVAAPLVMLVEYAGEATLPDDAVVAVDQRDRARLWGVRESLSELMAREGLVHKLDVSIAPSGLEGLAERIADILTHPTVTSRLVFGHLLDGNLHIAFVGPAADDTALEDRLLHAVADANGSISAEHGIGRQKAHALHLSRSAAEIHTMRAIKDALDPHGILNPGVLFQ